MILRKRKAPEDYDVPICPVCGEECDTFYKQGGIILGCDECVEYVNAWQEMEDENLRD